MAPQKRYFVVAAFIVTLFIYSQLDFRAKEPSPLLHTIFGGIHTTSSAAPSLPTEPPKDKEIPESKPADPISDENKPSPTPEDDVCNASPSDGATLNEDALSLLKSKQNIRVAEVSVHIGGALKEDYYLRALKTHHHYAQYHNYTFYDLQQNMIEPTMWNKQAFILSVILDEMRKPASERLEWLYWFDGDSMVLNYCIPLQIYLPTLDSAHVLIAADDFGINAGAFAIRVSSWSIDFLTTVLGFRFSKPDVQLVFLEQSAMDIVAQTPPFEGGMVKVPNRWFNAYKHASAHQDQQVQQGDLLLHFPGEVSRKDVMTEWLKKVENKKGGWVADWRVGKLGTEIVEFWKKAEEAEKQKIAEKLAGKLKEEGNKERQ